MRQIFDLVDVKLFLQFQEVRPKQRVINKLVSDFFTFGAAKPPVEIYQGATAREKVRAVGEKTDLPPKETNSSSGENKSLGNVSRGDKTPIELFIAGVRGRELGLRRQMEDDKFSGNK